MLIITGRGCGQCFWQVKRPIIFMYKYWHEPQLRIVRVNKSIAIFNFAWILPYCSAMDSFYLLRNYDNFLVRICMSRLKNVWFFIVNIMLKIKTFF